MNINTIKIILIFILIPFILSMASVFVTHGGGPFPLIDKEEHAQFYKHLNQIATKYPNPKAIILFSAHWQENDWTIMDHDNPPLYYDYYGFPPETYNLTYPIRSSTELRNHVKQELLNQGIKLNTNTKRGYDHGTFIPLMIAYPKANIPVIQISILKSLNPQAHFRMGQALRGLKNQGYLIMGSGSSVHGGFGHQDAAQRSKIFDAQLTQKWIDPQYNEEKTLDNIKNWRSLTHSKFFHPREEHLVPIFVNLGAFEGKYKKNQKYFIMGVHCSNFILQ